VRLTQLVVRNFRGLESIEVAFDNRVNVIVGPNAVGKTTVLEAIRLAKALLAPRTQNEPGQTLQSLRIAVPHYPQRIFPGAVARDAGKSIEIRCRYEFGERELGRLDGGVSQIATGLVLAGLGRAFGNSAENIPFLSSPQGAQMLSDAESQLRQALADFRSKKRTCNLDVAIEPSGRFGGGDPISSAMFSFLDVTLPPSSTIFSYFPADRALPFGEPPVQLGIADASQQIESYVSQPQLKYQRLKNTIFSAVIAGSAERDSLWKDFQDIFDGVLKGRRFESVGVNEYGLLSIKVQDTETGRFFDLDGMSSGEKGLVLTFLLVGRSIANGGLILLDEPELHLNPAVCRNLVHFLVDKYIVPRDLQAVVCSHSPEILAGAFDRAEECSLFHLASENMLTKVRRKDEDQISQALRRLGTSESEGLLYKGTVFVEGEEDIELIEAGFGDLLRRFRLKDLGGRREVEKQIALLQQAERDDSTMAPCYFVFDRDGMPSDLKDSAKVRVLQWQRRCLENYLIDVDTLTDLLQDSEVLPVPLSSLGEVNKLLQEIAFSQLDDVIAKAVYTEYTFEDPGIRVPEIQGKDIEEIAGILFSRLKRIGQQTSGLAADWKESFESECHRRKKEILAVWEVKWHEQCDGKRLFRDLHRKLRFRISSRRLKKRVIQEMARNQTEAWRSMESLLKALVQ
jgi:predicted ATPase